MSQFLYLRCNPPTRLYRVNNNSNSTDNVVAVTVPKCRQILESSRNRSSANLGSETDHQTIVSVNDLVTDGCNVFIKVTTEGLHAPVASAKTHSHTLLRVVQFPRSYSPVTIDASIHKTFYASDSLGIHVAVNDRQLVSPHNVVMANYNLLKYGLVNPPSLYRVVCDRTVLALGATMPVVVPITFAIQLGAAYSTSKIVTAYNNDMQVLEGGKPKTVYITHVRPYNKPNAKISIRKFVSRREQIKALKDMLADAWVSPSLLDVTPVIAEFPTESSLSPRSLLLHA